MKKTNRTTIIIIVLAALVLVYLYMRKQRKNPLPVPDDRDGNDNNDNDDNSEKFTDDSFPLADGSGGENVRTLQKMLQKLGAELPKYGVDGKFGSETKTALTDLNYAPIVTEHVMDGIIADVQEQQSSDDSFWKNLL